MPHISTAKDQDSQDFLCLACLMQPLRTVECLTNYLKHHENGIFTPCGQQKGGFYYHLSIEIRLMNRNYFLRILKIAVKYALL